MRVNGDIKRRPKNGGLEDLQKRMKDARGRSVVKVGIQETAGAHQGEAEGLSVADVGSFHEFGTDNIPQRSFIRAPIQDNKADLQGLQRTLLREVMLGNKSTGEALALIGEKAQSDMVAAINAGIEPGLEQSTIDAKGSSTPLIDSGQLKQSIRYKVET